MRRMAHEEAPGCLLINARRVKEKLEKSNGWVNQDCAGWKGG